jgi:hypothetical protein
MEDARYGDQSGFFDSLRRDAARSMAETCIEKSSLYEKRVPKPGDWNYREDGWNPIHHVWRVGIMRDMDEVKAREKQMAEAKDAGRLEAASTVRKFWSDIAYLYGNQRSLIEGVIKQVAEKLEAST